VPKLTREQSIERLADHHRHPRHAGRMAEADVAAGAGNPGCGDVVTVYLKTVPGSDRVEAASFEGTGCTISQGSASILLQEINRRHPTLAELKDLSFAEYLDDIGREVVGFREPCAAVGFDALRRAASALETERKLIDAGYTPEQARRMRVDAERGTGSGSS
jgi:nitrogen fixation NifU-like protein